ncbi:MAG: hypothetical protein IKO79_02795 [Butyrivibrio sp.]|nr:hypothetical protein [Butyrivibrio sp.]
MKTLFKHKSLLIFITTVIMCCFSIMGGCLDYAGNDDTFRNLISAGAFGDIFNFYMPNSNILYGVPAYLLNMILPQINWYYWIMVGLSVISISASCSICLEKCDLFLAEAITVFINIILARDYYIAVQYTKSASLWIISGFIIIFHSICKENLHWIWGALLFVYGTSERFKCMLMALPFFAVFITVFYLANYKQQNLPKFKVIIKPVIALVLGIIILLVSEHSFRTLHPEWKAYWEYDKASVNLRDYMGLDYQHNPSAYDLIDTDENDIALYSNWLFGDIDFYDISWLKNVYSIEQPFNNRKIRLSSDIIKLTFISLFDIHTRNPFESLGPVFLTWIFIIFLLFRKKYTDKLFGLGILGCTLMMYWYFACINRFMWRVEIGVFLSAVFLSGFYLSMTQQDIIRVPSKKKQILFLCVAVILFGAYSVGMTYQWRYVKDKHIVEHEADISGRLETFVENPENFYILTDFYVTNNPASLTYSKWNNLFSNSCYAGNWVLPSPTALHSAREHGFDNPMTALISQKPVFLHCDSEDKRNMIITHLKKISKHDIEATEFPDNIWKFELR